MGWPALGNLGKKKDDADFDRCVQHYYRPAKGQCSVCHSPLCEECFGAGSVPICKQCFENPMNPEEAAKARARRARVAKKPVPKKAKKVAPPKPKAGKKLLSKISMKAGQKKLAMAVALSVLGPILIILTLLTVLGKNPFGIVKPVVAPEVRAQQVKMFVSGAVGRIELYRMKNGKLPESLKEIGIMDPKSWKYEVISADQYVVEVAMDGQAFSFNSNQDYRTVFPGLTVSEPKRRAP